MKRKDLLSKPVAISELTDDDLYQEADGNRWQEKAARIQARRWRKLRHQSA